MEKWKIMRFILSHHPPSQISRTIRIKFLNKKVYLCARCSGECLGIITVFMILYFLKSLPLFLHASLIFFLPIPAIVDWTTQTMGYRESNNLLRLGTGMLFGGALVLFAYCILLNRLTLFCLSSGFYFFYCLIPCFILKRSGKLDQYLEYLDKEAKGVSFQ
uniref:DUF2085 domain-containing protein n=1 Tax=candidate division CPR3 bacterium TaxID=2268181 RepID=A0A7V3JAN2_UNCC3